VRLGSGLLKLLVVTRFRQAYLGHVQAEVEIDLDFFPIG
jgi:hypothetical protein